MGPVNGVVGTVYSLDIIIEYNVNSIDDATLTVTTSNYFRASVGVQEMYI